MGGTHVRLRQSERGHGFPEPPKQAPQTTYQNLLRFSRAHLSKPTSLFPCPLIKTYFVVPCPLIKTYFVFPCPLIKTYIVF